MDDKNVQNENLMEKEPILENAPSTEEAPVVPFTKPPRKPFVRRSRCWVSTPTSAKRILPFP